MDVTVHAMLMWIVLLLAFCTTISDGICTKSKNIANYGTATWSIEGGEEDATNTADGDVSTQNTFKMKIYTGQLTFNCKDSFQESDIELKSKGQNRCNATVSKKEYGKSTVKGSAANIKNVTIELRCVVQEIETSISLDVNGCTVSIPDIFDRKCEADGSHGCACSFSLKSSGSWYFTFDSIQVLSEAILDVHVSENCNATLHAGLHIADMTEIGSQEMQKGHRTYNFEFKATAIKKMEIKFICDMPSFKKVDVMLYEVKVHAPSPFDNNDKYALICPLKPTIDKTIKVKTNDAFTDNIWIWKLPLKIELELILEDTVIPLHGLQGDVISYFYNRENIAIVAKENLKDKADFIHVRVWHDDRFPLPSNTTEWKNISEKKIEVDVHFERFDLIVVQVRNKNGNTIEGKGYSSSIICDKFTSGVCDVVFGFNYSTVVIWFTEKTIDEDQYRIQTWSLGSCATVKELTFEYKSSENAFIAVGNYPSRYDASFISTFEYMTPLSASTTNLHFYNMGDLDKNNQNKPESKLLEFTISPSPKVAIINGKTITDTAGYVIFKQWKVLDIKNYYCEKNSSIAEFAGNHGHDFVYTVHMQAPFLCSRSNFVRYAIGWCNEKCEWNIQQCTDDCSDDDVQADNSSFRITYNEIKSVRYWCHTGYKHVAGSLIMFCDEYGRWRGEKPTCEVADPCSYDHLVANHSSYTISKTSEVKYVEYQCDKGYKHVNGNLIMFCGGNGVWIGDKPTCDVADPCSYDHLVANHSSHTISKNSKVKYVEYQCDKGYKHVNGNLIMFCDENGVWIGDKPTCEEIKCDEKALRFSGTKYNNSGTSVGDIASFECEDKYRPVRGDRIRVCQADGTWNGTYLICNEMKCDKKELPSPDANYQNNGTSVGDIATFECEDEYKRVGGDRVRVCQADGTWNGTSLICEATEEKLKAIEKELKEKLLVKRTDSKNYQNSKISVYEDEPTVLAVGVIFGIVLLAFEFALIVIPDIPTIYRHFIGYHIKRKEREKA